jgi:hypothetical protein
LNNLTVELNAMFAMKSYQINIHPQVLDCKTTTHGGFFQVPKYYPAIKLDLKLLNNKQSSSLSFFLIEQYINQ